MLTTRTPINVSLSLRDQLALALIPDPVDQVALSRRMDQLPFRSRWRNARPHLPVLLPAIAVPIVLVLAGLFNDQILRSAPPAAQGSGGAFAFRFAPGPPPFEEFAARVEWAASALAFLLVGLGSAAIAVYVWFAALPRESVRPYVAVGVQVALAVIAALLLYFLSPTFESFVLREPFLNRTVYRLFPAALSIGAAIDILAALVIALVTIAVCVATKAVPLNRSRVPDENTKKTQAAHALRSVRHVRVLLAAAAITMVAGVLQLGSLYRWGTTMVLPDAPPTEKSSPLTSAPTALPYLPDSKLIAQSASLAGGVVYTGLLAGIFVPAFAVLRSRMRALAATHCPDATEEERDKWLTKQGLVATLPKQALSALAVLAPLLVGGPGSLLVKLLGGE